MVNAVHGMMAERNVGMVLRQEMWKGVRRPEAAAELGARGEAREEAKKRMWGGGQLMTAAVSVSAAGGGVGGGVPVVSVAVVQSGDGHNTRTLSLSTGTGITHRRERRSGSK